MSPRAPGAGAGVKVVVERSLREPCVVHPTRVFSQPLQSNLKIDLKIPPSSKNCGENVLSRKGFW
jgi:hypothetical protein